MEIILGVLIVTGVIGRGLGLAVADAKYAAKGKDHPRWAYRQGRLDAIRKGEPVPGYLSTLFGKRAWDKSRDLRAEKAAKQKTKDRTPGPLQAYLGRCWADAWDTELDRHDHRRERRWENREQKRQAGDPVTAPTDADLAPTVAEGQSVDDAFNTAPREQPAPVASAQGTDTAETVGAPDIINPNPPEGEGEDSPRAPAQAGGVEPWNPFATAAEPPDSDTAATPNPKEANTVAPNHDDTANAPNNVIPFNKPLPTPKGTTDMTALNTEIEGLESAIAWADDVKTNAGTMASGIDDVESDFAARKVTGESLSLVGQIGEAYTELEGLAAQLSQKLIAMNDVNEAYEANPDAGDKEFVTT